VRSRFSGREEAPAMKHECSSHAALLMGGTAAPSAGNRIY
jgi:hypothetical protein